MQELRAYGVLVTRGEPLESFLLLRHPTRWDLPKGHMEPGESDEQCALRELQEETGIAPDRIALDPDFLFTTHYRVQSRRTKGQWCEKTVGIYLGRLLAETPLILTEHTSYRWFRWAPPHHIQPETIDPLLSQLAEYLAAC